MIAHPIGEKTLQLYCTGCKKPGDIVNWEEFVELSRGTYGPYYCFDCDSRHVDEVPTQLLGNEFPYLLKIGDHWTLVDPWQTAPESMLRFFMAITVFQNYINRRKEEAKRAYSNFCNQANID